MAEHPLDLLASWTEALLAERDEERQRLTETLAGASLRIRRAEGFTWSPVEVTEASYAFGGAKWHVVCQEGGGLPGIFRVGAAVLLTPVGDHDAVAMWGTWPARVMGVRGMEMDVVLEGDGPEGVAVQHIRWTVDARADERSYQAMAHALSHWVNVEDSEAKAFRDAVLGIGPWLEGSKPSVATEAALPGLNGSQREAVQRMLSDDPVVVLHGPPGTGKTRTLVAGIHAQAQAGRKVLATAPSNMAVDVLAQRLNEAGLRVVRLGHPMRAGEDVRALSLDAHVMAQPEYVRVTKTRQAAEQSQRDADRHVRTFGSEQREARRAARAEARALRKEADDLEAYLAEKVLREADVVCATLVGCDDRRLWSASFDLVVVDEAAQALTPATLIALRRAPRIVLCGDPCQLPPTVKSQRGKPLAQTLLERLMAAHPDRATMLNVQHRMHAAIMAAGNVRFYGGNLQAHASVADATQGDLRPWLWVDTAGCGFDESRSEEGGSVSNSEEAHFVLNRAAEWLTSHPEMSIGVVAPYAAQVELLRSLWHARAVSGDVPASADVTIHTVDGFQGQERDGMLVSMTRSNARGEVGFLSESRRIHVAQTRARRACMLVGDSATLSADPYLGWLLEFAQDHDAYDSAWSWLVQN